ICSPATRRSGCWARARRSGRAWQWRRHAGETVFPESVWAVSAFAAEPDDQDDEADQRNEYQQEPPAAAVRIVQSPHRDSQAGQDGGEIPDRAGYLSSDKVVDDQADDADDQREQHPVPVLRPARATGEVHVVGKSKLDRVAEVHGSPRAHCNCAEASKPITRRKLTFGCKTTERGKPSRRCDGRGVTPYNPRRCCAAPR